MHRAAWSCTPAPAGPVPHAMGSTDPWCHCCTPATEDRSTRKPLGTDSSAQDNQRRRRGERAPEKSKLEWKAGGRDNREVLQGWWEMWLGDELREGRLQQQRLRQGQEMVPEPRGHAQPAPRRAGGRTRLPPHRSAKQPVASLAPALPCSPHCARPGLAAISPGCSRGGRSPPVPTSLGSWEQPRSSLQEPLDTGGSFPCVSF